MICQKAYGVASILKGQGGVDNESLSAADPQVRVQEQQSHDFWWNSDVADFKVIASLWCEFVYFEMLKRLLSVMRCS